MNHPPLWVLISIFQSPMFIHFQMGQVFFFSAIDCQGVPSGVLKHLEKHDASTKDVWQMIAHVILAKSDVDTGFLMENDEIDAPRSKPL